MELVPIPGQVDITEVLQDFNWKAGSDANDLEAKLIAELQALEAVCERSKEINVYVI